jgi:hypothetical protein
MIERLQLIATFLGRIQPLIIVLGLVCLLLFLLGLFQAGGVTDDELMLPALAGFCWAVLLFSCARLFRHVPAVPAPGAGIRTRLSIRLRRGLLWLLAIALLVVGLAVLVLTWQLLRIWSSG